MENLIKMDDLGGFPPIFGNTHITHRRYGIPMVSKKVCFFLWDSYQKLIILKIYIFSCFSRGRKSIKWREGILKSWGVCLRDFVLDTWNTDPDSDPKTESAFYMDHPQKSSNKLEFSVLRSELLDQWCRCQMFNRMTDLKFYRSQEKKHQLYIGFVLLLPGFFLWQIKVGTVGIPY